MGLRLKRGDVLARIVSSFTEATRVEKDCKRKIGIEENRTWPPSAYRAQSQSQSGRAQHRSGHG